ncbi:MAG: MDR family MFS transporter [Micrococcales bacterium]
MSRDARKAAAAESAKTGVMTHRQIMFVLLGLMAGMFLSALDQSVVGTAMKTIADDLKGLELQAWVTTAYLITSTITTPIYGKLGDIFGRRRLFIFAITVFIVGSVLCGTSQSMYELAAWRAVQGIGAGGLFTMALTVMADIVPPRERARYQGMFLAVFGTSSVLGPLVGGLFAGADQILWVTGWRWVFLINLPIGIIALLMVVAFLHVPHTPVKHRIDWWGAVTIIVAVVPLLLVAEQGREWGWDSFNSVSMYVLGAVGIVAFIIAERAAGEEALLPLKLFKSTTFSMSTILGVIVGVGMFGGMMTIPLLLQIVLGASPMESGFMMMPMVFGMMTATMTAGQITSRTGKYKLFLVIGTALLTLGYVYFFLIFNAETQYWQMAIGMVVIGLGLGQLMQTLVIASQNSVEAKDVGVATSSSTFFRQIGGTLGVAIFLSILFNNLSTSIADAFKDSKVVEGLKQVGADVMAGKALQGDEKTNMDLLTAMKSGDMSAVGDQMNSDSSFINNLDPRLAAPFKMGFANASLSVFLTAAFVIAVAFVLTFFVKEIALRDKSAMAEKADAAAAAAH